MNEDTEKNALHVITCVVQRGKADKLARAAMDAGAGGATVCFARGMGVRERLGLLGLAIVPEKEVVTIVCTKQQIQPLMKAINAAGHLDVPGHGIAYAIPVTHAVGFIPNETEKSS